MRSHCTPALAKAFNGYLLRSYVADSEFARYCPGVDCNRVIEYPKNDRNRRIECDCGHAFCFGCGERNGHLPLRCELCAAWEDRKHSASDVSTGDLWMAVNCKNCPKKEGGCGRLILKNEGCMHMTCRRAEGGCGFEFCWLCLGKYSTHSSTTGGYFKCNIYTKKAAMGTLEGQARAAHAADQVKEDQKKLLAFYEFHVSRHVFQLDSADAARGRDVAALRATIEACLAGPGAGEQARARARARSATLARGERCRRRVPPRARLGVRRRVLLSARRRGIPAVQAQPRRSRGPRGAFERHGRERRRHEGRRDERRRVGSLVRERRGGRGRAAGKDRVGDGAVREVSGEHVRGAGV